MHAYSDFAATREQLLGLEGVDAAILHIGAHARVSSASNEGSGIVLSLFDARGGALQGFVSYYDLLQIRRAPALVVLSGCDTALGLDLHGEGPVGLARAFMYAGATQVVSNLWSVGEQSSVQLMSAFYAGLLQEHLPTAVALQEAQQALRKGGRRFRHPHSWAGVTVSYRWPASGIVYADTSR